MNARRLFAGAGLVFFLGCGAGGTHPFSPASAPPPGEVLPVPFFPDSSDQCGPSALASVLRYWGRPVEPEELRKEIYVAKLRGSLPMDLMLAARAHGLAAEMSEGSLPALKRELDAGRPVIAFVNLGFRLAPIGHFLVVTGYDTKGVFAHSGTRKDSFMTYREFDRRWAKTGRWTLMMSRPS